MHLESIVIVTPALADANNGNSHTAYRWARMLRPAYRVRVVDRWTGDRPVIAGNARNAIGAGDDSLMVALHARRSAASISAWRDAHPSRPLVVTLTGTDLYRDIDIDATARRSLTLADTLVVLNELGAERLPAAVRVKCRVLLQSCPSRATLPKTGLHLRALMVGHLRVEKDPETCFRAMARLGGRADIRLDHVGSALDPVLGDAATRLAGSHAGYRWLGALSHAATRRRIQAAHVLVHPSWMEGGANVVIEAVRSGTPVLASRIDGNIGLLGDDYPGCFDPGDDAALAALLVRARDDPAMLPDLVRRVSARAPLFSPAAESATLHRLIADLIGP